MGLLNKLHSVGGFVDVLKCIKSSLPISDMTKSNDKWQQCWMKISLLYTNMPSRKGDIRTIKSSLPLNLDTKYNFISCTCRKVTTAGPLLAVIFIYLFILLFHFKLFVVINRFSFISCGVSVYFDCNQWQTVSYLITIEYRNFV